MARQGRSGAAATRLLAKLKASMENEDYYEAHQLFRTLNFRYSGQKMYKELEELLYDGAVKLFKCNQDGSGSDLSKLYLENLEKAEFRPGEEFIRRIVRLFALIPPHLPDKDIFKNEALKWSTDKQYPSGHPRLHQLLAYEFWKLKRYPEARHHFLHSTDGSGCGHMLAEFQAEKGYPSEVDLFVVGTVLQLLCLRKHIVAAVTLKSYAESHPGVDGQGPPYKQPLMNFVWMLLLAIEHKQSIEVYSTLVEKYKASLIRDTAYNEYLDKIGQHFFGLPPPKKAKPGGMFGGLFDSLLNAFVDDDDDEVEDGPGSGMRPSTSKAGTSNTKELKDLTWKDLD